MKEKITVELTPEQERNARETRKDLEASSKDVDPFTSSPLLAEDKLVFRGKNIDHWKKHHDTTTGRIKTIRDSLNVKIDPHTGVEYVAKKLPSNSGVENTVPKEHFVSLLTHGLLHTSSIYTTEKAGVKRYYSQIVPLENAKYPHKGEYEAEAFLMNYLFADPDKYTHEGTSRNVVTQGSKFAFYDYTKSFNDKGYKNPFAYKQTRDDMELRKNIHQELGRLLSYGHVDLIKEQTPIGTIKKITRQLLSLGRKKDTELLEKAQTQLLAKTKKFAELFGDEKFFSSAIKKSGITIDSLSDSFPFLTNISSGARAQELRDRLLERAEILVDVLEKEAKK